MSATNKTTNIELPLFVGTDVPSWLGDWNSSMTTIDSQIATAKSDAQGAASTAQAASESAAQTAQGLIASNNNISKNQTDINLIKTELNSASSTLTAAPNVNLAAGDVYMWGHVVVIRINIVLTADITATRQTTWGAYLNPIATFSNIILPADVPSYANAMWLGSNLMFSTGFTDVNFRTVRLWAESGLYYIGVETNTSTTLKQGMSLIANIPIVFSGTFTGEI